MTDEEPEKWLKEICGQAVGRQAEIDTILAIPLKRARDTANIVLAGPAGAGKTAMMEGLSKQIAAQGLADRFKDIVLLKPFSPEQVKELVGAMIDKNGKMPESRKEEAKAIVQEMIDQGLYDENSGLRSLRPLINAIADVSSEPDMREALTGKYPVLLQRVSIKSGERLAESFTGGTSDKTRALKPYRFKSRGVGFFALD